MEIGGSQGKIEKKNKTLTIFLFTSPYGFENSSTAARLAEAALDKGYSVNLFASSDGVYNFMAGQKAVAIPNIQQEFEKLINKGLKVYLCGPCLNFRGIQRQNLMENSKPSSLTELFAIMGQSNVFLCFSF